MQPSRMRIFVRLAFLALASLCAPMSAAEEHAALKVGVILPLSGEIAGMGDAFRKGFLLHNEDTHSTAVQFLFEDDRYDGKSAVSGLHKLRDVDRADMIIVWGNTPSGSCAPVAEERGIPLIAVSFNPEAKGRRHVLTFGPKTERLVAKAAEQFQSWKLQNPAAVSIDIGNALLGVRMLGEQLHGRLVVRTVANAETDFKAILAGLRAKRVDGVMLLTMPEQALTFIRQAAELRYPLKVVGGDIFAQEAFQAAVQKQLPDLVFVYGAVEPGFLARVKQRFGTASYFFETASGYALAALLERLGREQPRGGAQLIEALTRVEPSGLPVLGVRLVRDEEYGVHFENDAAVYRLNAVPTS